MRPDTRPTDAISSPSSHVAGPVPGLPGWSLSRNAFGRLVLSHPPQPDIPVTPIRSFPITAPDEHIALVGVQGQELASIEHLRALPTDARRLVEEDLAQREFRPEILRIRHASTWATPSHWDVETDRGPTRLTLKAEEDIRRLSATSLLIADAHGVQYLVRDMAALDKASRRILDHFL
ncbi:MAG: DUF1854 domain-containing protein [Castellaniella sp.]|uniref:cyanophycin metabolism-associated DUF1854 family protein n=1 Tax=Castellaniella sp. TaxID=1955812 RepID=UPI003A8C051A